MSFATDCKAYTLSYKEQPKSWLTKSFGVFFALTLTEAFTRARRIVADETGGTGILVDVFETTDPREQD